MLANSCTAFSALAKTSISNISHAFAFILFIHTQVLYAQLDVAIIAMPGLTICSGIPIVLSADTSGVVNPTAIIFQWSNGETGSSTTISTGGVYTLTVTDTLINQSATDIVTVTMGTNPAPQLAHDPATLCSNAWAVFRVENPVTVQDSRFDWKITPVAPAVPVTAADTVQSGPVLFVHWRNTGAYIVEVSESRKNGASGECTGSAAQVATVLANNTPDAAIIGHFKPNNILICKDNQAGCYQWGYFDPRTYAFVELNGETFQAYSAGDSFSTERKYWVKTWNATDCSQPASCATVSFRIEPVELPGSDVRQLKLFPNPSSGTFQIEISKLQGPEYTLHVYDMLGRIIYQQQAQVGITGLLDETIRLDNAPNGLYRLVLYDGKGALLTRAVQISN